MSHKTSRTFLAADVLNGGTFTVGYPMSTDPGDFALGKRHYITSNTYGPMYAGEDAAFSFGAASVTITNNSGQTLVAGTEIIAQFDQLGEAGYGADTLANFDRMAFLQLVSINLGAPDTADADGIAASQSIGAAGSAVINGALAASGVAYFDKPRNVVAAWTNTSVITITGTDEYGQVVVESSASGTSHAGKKAFKTITGITSTASITGFTAGSGDVLGLPMFLPGSGLVVREMQALAAATAGTVVAGDQSIPTATTGDVRGTYDPNAACDGARAFTLVAMIDEPGDRGLTQFGG